MEDHVAELMWNYLIKDWGLVGITAIFVYEHGA